MELSGISQNLPRRSSVRRKPKYVEGFSRPSNVANVMHLEAEPSQRGPLYILVLSLRQDRSENVHILLGLISSK